MPKQHPLFLYTTRNLRALQSKLMYYTGYVCVTKKSGCFSGAVDFIYVRHFSVIYHLVYYRLKILILIYCILFFRRYCAVSHDEKYTRLWTGFLGKGGISQEKYLHLGIHLNLQIEEHILIIEKAYTTISSLGYMFVVCSITLQRKYDNHLSKRQYVSYTFPWVNLIPSKKILTNRWYFVINFW